MTGFSARDLNEMNLDELYRLKNRLEAEIKSTFSHVYSTWIKNLEHEADTYAELGRVCKAIVRKLR